MKLRSVSEAHTGWFGNSCCLIPAARDKLAASTIVDMAMPPGHVVFASASYLCYVSGTCAASESDNQIPNRLGNDRHSPKVAQGSNTHNSRCSDTSAKSLCSCRNKPATTTTHHQSPASQTHSSSMTYNSDVANKQDKNRTNNRNFTRSISTRMHWVMTENTTQRVTLAAPMCQRRHA